MSTDGLTWFQQQQKWSKLLITLRKSPRGLYNCQVKVTDIKNVKSACSSWIMYVIFHFPGNSNIFKPFVFSCKKSNKYYKQRHQEQRPKCFISHVVMGFSVQPQWLMWWQFNPQYTPHPVLSIIFLIPLIIVLRTLPHEQFPPLDSSFPPFQSSEFDWKKTSSNLI